MARGVGWSWGIQLPPTWYRLQEDNIRCHYNQALGGKQLTQADDGHLSRLGLINWGPLVKFAE